MSKLTIKLLLSAALMVGMTNPARAQDDETAVRGVIESFARFSQEKNLAAIDSLWALDEWVHIIEGSGVNHGWIDYRDNHLAPELEEFENFVYRYFAIEPQVRGNVAWSPFRYELAFDGENGTVEIEGRGTAVLEKRDGSWLIVHLHTSGRRKRR